MREMGSWASLGLRGKNNQISLVWGDSPISAHLYPSPNAFLLASFFFPQAVEPVLFGP